jgi:hypothetical protein
VAEHENTKSKGPAPYLTDVAEQPASPAASVESRLPRLAEKKLAMERLNGWLKAHGLTLGDALNIALFVLTLASLGLAWQGIKIARQAIASSDTASGNQVTLFNKQLDQQEKAAVALDRVERRFEAIDKLQPSMDLKIFCGSDSVGEVDGNRRQRLPPVLQIDVDAHGLANCHVYLENLGTDLLRGAKLEVIIGSDSSTQRPRAVVSKAGGLNFKRGLIIGTYDVLSVDSSGQAAVETGFVLKVLRGVDTVHLWVNATAQNAPWVGFDQEIPIHIGKRIQLPM